MCDEASPTPARDCRLLSLLVPVFNEQENLPVLYQRVRDVVERLGVAWEIILVDDFSADASRDSIEALATSDPEHVRGLFFARNFGSHAALTAALHHAAGDCAVVLAADLQDPPELIPELLRKWGEGSPVVLAVRAERKGIPLLSRLCSGFANQFIRRYALPNAPATGADFLLLDRQVIDALRQLDERNSSLLGLVYWLGFPQAEVPYVKEARLHGRSGWTFRKLVNLFANTFFSFSTMPLRGMTMVGLLLACLGVLVVAAGLLSGPRATQLGLPLLGLVLGSLAVACGVNLVALGVLGEYIWRVADEVRGRPRYLVARTVNLNSEAGASSPDQTSRGVR